MKPAVKMLKLFLLSLIVLVVASCGGKEDRKAAYFKKGKAYLEEFDLDKARIEFKNVMQIDPKFAEAYYYMGVLEEKNKEISKSYGYFKNAVELDPDYLAPKLKLAEIYTVIGGDDYLEKAKKLLWDILAKDEDNIKAKLIWQQISYKEGNEEQAIKKIEALVEEDPLLDGGVILLSAAYLADNKIDKSLEMLNRGIRANEGDMGLRLKKVSTLFHAERFDEAEKELIEIVNLDKNLFSSQLALSSFYAKRNQVEKAENILREGVNAKPKDVKRALVLVQFLLLRKGTDSAIDELNKMIAAQPEAYELQLNLAKIYRGIGDNKKAKEIYTNISESSKGEADAVHAKNLLATILLSEADYDGAELLLNEVLKDYPQNVDALRLISQISMRDGDYETVVTNLRTVLKSQPSDSTASDMLSRAHTALGQHDLAEKVLKTGSEVDVKNVPGFINYAAYLYDHKRLADADEVITDARKMNKQDYDLQIFALRVAATKNDPKELESILDDMKKTNPDKSEVYIKRAQFYAAIKNSSQSLAELNMSLEKSLTPIEVVKSLQLISAHYLSQNQASKAIDFMMGRIDKNQEDILSMYALANIYVATKDLEKARKYYNSVIQINKKWPDPYMSLSSLSVAEGDLNQAIATLKEGVAASGGDVKLQLNLANYLQRNDQIGESKKIYENILKISPANKLALNNLATILLDNSEEDGAVERALFYASKLNVSQNPAFKDTLAWAYAKSGKYQESIDLLQATADKFPKAAVYQYHLGYSLYHIGKKEDAKAYLEKAVDTKQRYVGVDDAKKLLTTY